MAKTKRLEITCAFSDTAAVYPCLATGLVAHDGIPELELHGIEPLEADAAKGLAEAIVGTTCLKRLKLTGEHFRDGDVCSVLVEALKRNRSVLQQPFFPG